MKTLRIKDNDKTPKAEFTNIKSLTKIISDKTLEQLDSEGIFVFPPFLKNTDDLTKDQIILQSYNEYYKSSNVIGFIGIGDERLTITSRFSSTEHDFFFQYMLEKVLNLPSIVDFQTDAGFDNSLFNLYVFLFPYYLKNALRKGLFKTYIRKHYNDENLKGIIDIPRHISQNTPFIGKIAYNQREYSYDNYLTELVRHTIEYINNKSYGKRLFINIKDEIKLVKSATPKYELYDRNKIITENTNKTIRHTYYREYRDLQKLCLLILKNQKHNIGSGSRQIYGILFDAAWLWEEYIASLLNEHFYHPMNKGRKGAQHLFSGNNGLIYPDFIGKKHQIIADAKYKPFKNINGTDYLQLLAYMFRFDAKEGYYFYPENTAPDNSKLYLNSGCTYNYNVKQRDNIFVMKHGLIIPDKASDYNDFKSKIKSNEAQFQQLF